MILYFACEGQVWHNCLEFRSEVPIASDIFLLELMLGVVKKLYNTFILVFY